MPTKNGPGFVSPGGASHAGRRLADLDHCARSTRMADVRDQRGRDRRPGFSVGDDLIDALVGAGFAFEEAGLPWVARNYTLASVSQEFSAFKRYGSIGALRASVLSRYFDTEFKLGRVPQILSGSTASDRVRLKAEEVPHLEGGGGQATPPSKRHSDDRSRLLQFAVAFSARERYVGL